MYNYVEYQRQYRADPINRAKQQLYSAVYRADPKFLERRRARELGDPSIREQKLRYNRSEKGKARARARQKIRLRTDPEFKLCLYVRARLNKAIKRGAKTGSAVADLGCSVAEFRCYIERQFLAGMTWNNWGLWHLDHKRPLVSFDLTERAQHWLAFHYTNYQPLWALDNLKKGGKNV